MVKDKKAKKKLGRVKLYELTYRVRVPEGLYEYRLIVQTKGGKKSAATLVAKSKVIPSNASSIVLWGTRRIKDDVVTEAAIMTIQPT